jgi:transcriptional regulator with XRE-family HTH domain
MADKRTLGSLLKEVRETKGISMRQVEKEVGISTAYLSQLENGTIAKPSPDKLYRLASLYEASYQDFMVAAGYIAPDPKVKSRIIDTAFSSLNLTDDERRLVLDYIDFLRKKRE